MKAYKAYLRVRHLTTREIVHSVGVNDLSENHIEKVMMGMLRNMNRENFFIDDSEVDKAREDEKTD